MAGERNLVKKTQLYVQIGRFRLKNERDVKYTLHTLNIKHIKFHSKETLLCVF